MADLADADLLALARAAGVTIPPELLPEVGYTLNAALEALDNAAIPGLAEVEPLPIIPPPPAGHPSPGE